MRGPCLLKKMVPEKVREEKVPLDGVEGAGAEEAPKDSSLLTAGD